MKERRSFTGLAQYIVLIGLIGTLIYIFVSYESQGASEFLKHFLSTENMGIRFRALILFTPLITMAIAYLVHEREKYLDKVMVSEDELREKNEELQAFNERLSALRSIDMAISTSIDLQATLKIMIEKIMSQLKIDAVDVLLLSPDTNMLVYSAGEGFLGKEAESVKLSIGKGFAGQIADDLEKLYIEDIDGYLNGSGGNGSEYIRDSHLYRDEKIKSYFGFPLSSHDRFLGVLELMHRTEMSPDEEWYSFLETIAAQAAIAINKASLFTELQESNIELVRAYDTTIEGWARALDYRDKETEGHSRRVTDLTEIIAMVMGIDGDKLLHIKRGALLHDIGKMGVPDRILLKEGSLDPDERAIIERHPDIARNLLAPITFLRPTIDIPYCHHEKWDGSGYPRGLKGEEIPLGARIFAVVDVWDALRSDRPYRPAWSEERTIEHIKSLAGSHFDPKIVDIFIVHIVKYKAAEA
ncbi:MAG: HD domain-containing protein [Thermodesulfovibrionales bacterium]|nr:HD domain-containing protein [Thermodesulfovibrionales bacterium]